MLILILTQWAVGQAPDPDTPFTPYWEVDVQAEEKVCNEVVEITEPSDIRFTCWKEAEHILGADGVTVKFIVLPAGCVVLVLYKFKYQVDVHQDRECDMLIHNKSPGPWMLEDGKGLGA